MKKNHRKYLEKTLGKKNNFDSGKLLDDYEQFDVYQKEKDEDKQYEKLLHDTTDYKRSIPAHDFTDDPLYAGKKISKKEMYQEQGNSDELDDEEIQSDELSDDDLLPNKNKSNLKAFDVDEILEDIDKQDKEILKQEENKEEEIKKARAVKDQQILYDHMTEARVKMQDMLKIANRFPHPSAHPKLEKLDSNSQLKASMNDVQVELMDLIDLIEDFTVDYDSITNDEKVLTKRRRLLKTHSDLKSKGITKQKFDKLYQFDTEKLWQQLDNNFEAQLPILDKTITNWAQKFNLLTQSSLKGRFANIFQTPVQQAQKAMEDYDRLLKRSQVRDISGKVFFDYETKNSSYDEEIYNDDEFYVVLFREMLQRQGQANTQNEDEDGLLVDSTRLYLKNKLLQSKPKKDVDRRASKNRKLRYDVHQKLINFVAPVDNIHLLPGRDHLLKNLFGLNENTEDAKQVTEELAAKKNTKKANKNVSSNAIDDDEVRLF